MKKIVLKQIAILFLILLYINNAIAQEKDSVQDKFAILKQLLDKNHSLTGNGYGQAVDSLYAGPCIRQFSPDMYRHGINQKGGKSKIIWRRTRKITDWESFSGLALVDWLTHVPGLFPAGTILDHIEIRVVFGVYSTGFLEHYFPNDPNIRKEKANRIAAFLVPFLIEKIIDPKTKKLIIIETQGSGAYDLGNLHP